MEVAGDGGGRARSRLPLSDFMIYTVPSALMLLNMKYPSAGLDKSLLGEMPAAVWCFLAATGTYWLLAGWKIRAGNRKLIHAVALVCVLVTVVSLLAFFLPEEKWALFLPPAALLMWHAFKFVYLWSAAKVASVVDKIRAKVANIVDKIRAKQQQQQQHHILPVSNNSVRQSS